MTEEERKKVEAQAKETELQKLAQKAVAKVEKLEEKAVAKAAKGTTSYKIQGAYYRDSVLCEPGAVVAVPSEELPAEGWEETDDTPAYIFHDTDEKREAREKRQEKQERAEKRAAEVAARHPEVRAHVLAAQAAGAPHKK